MLGIPTQSDVKDENYQKAVRVENLEKAILKSQWPTNPHTAEAHCREKDVVRLHTVARRTNPSLDAQGLLDQYLNTITACRATLDEADREGFLQTQAHIQTGQHLTFIEEDTHGWLQRKIDTFRGRPTPGAADANLITVQENGKGYSAFSGEYTNWSYRFNPRTLAYRELELFENAMREAYANGKDDIERVLGLYDTAKRFDNREQKHFVDMTLFPYVGWPWSMEGEEGTEAWRLRKEHDRIARESDIHLQFDESDFYIKTDERGRYIAAKASDILSPTLTVEGLSARTIVRDGIEHAIELKTEVVLNGVRYRRDGVDSYVTDQEAPSSIADIFGAPVRTPQGYLAPQEELRDERELVQQYRATLLTTDTILAQYSGFGFKEGTSKRGAAQYRLAKALQNVVRPKESARYGNWS